MASSADFGRVGKTFRVGGVTNLEEHYVFDRAKWHGMLADKLAGGAYVMLHGHRQGGKSSAPRAVASLLEKRTDAGLRVLVFTVQCRGPVDSCTMWLELEERLRFAISAAPPGWAPPGIAAMLAVSAPLFSDAATFQAFFSPALWGQLRVVLIMDELDSLLNAPAAVRQELMSALRVARTMNSLAPRGHGKRSALHALLGIGVYRLLQLLLPAGADETGYSPPPFDVCETLTIPSTTLEQVQLVLDEVARDSGHALPEALARDMLWRSGGHVGLLSLLGKHLVELCDALAPGQGLDEASWAQAMSGTGMTTELRDSAICMSMLGSLSPRWGSGTVAAARELVRDLLAAPDGALFELAYSTMPRRQAADYLLSEGVLVEQEGKCRIVAPMVAPLLMRELPSRAELDKLPPLPFPRRLDGSVRLLQTMLETLPYLTLDAIFHPFASLNSGKPCEHAYRYQILDILSRRTSEDGWGVRAETRNATAPEPFRRPDLLIASGEQQCGIDVLVDGSNCEELDRRLYEQAPKYREQQRLSTVIVVNFASDPSGVVDRLREPLPAGVELLQVLVNCTDATLTPYELADDGLTAKGLAVISLATSIHGRRA